MIRRGSNLLRWWALPFPPGQRRRYCFDWSAATTRIPLSGTGLRAKHPAATAPSAQRYRIPGEALGDDGGAGRGQGPHADTVGQHPRGERLPHAFETQPLPGQLAGPARRMPVGLRQLLQYRPGPPAAQTSRCTTRATKWPRVGGHDSYVDSRMLASPTAFDPVLQVGKPPSWRPAHSGALELNGRTRRMNWNLVATLIGPRTDSDVLGFGVTNNPATVAWTWREATRVSQREGIWPRRESIRQTLGSDHRLSRGTGAATG